MAQGCSTGALDTPPSCSDPGQPHPLSLAFSPLLPDHVPFLALQQPFCSVLWSPTCGPLVDHSIPRDYPPTTPAPTSAGVAALPPFTTLSTDYAK